MIEAKGTKSIICPDLGTDATITYLIPEGGRVNPGDTVCILEAPEINTRYLNAVKDYENTKAEYNKALANFELQYIILESQVKIIESNTTIKGLDSAQFQFVSPTRRKLLELQLQKAIIEKEKNNDKLILLEKINRSELHKMQLRIQQAENRVNEAKSKLDLLTLKSDVEGMVIYATLWTSGEKIRLGDIVWGWMEIVRIPDMTGMVIKSQANETYFKQIEKDQRVDIIFDAHPEIQLNGKIRNKASIGKPIRENSQVKQYEVTIALDSAEFTITPGLSVSCSIYINEIQDIFFVPVVSVFDFDTSKIVYLASKGEYTRQIVKTAQSSSTEVIITEGLGGGEVVALSEPPMRLIKDN